MANNNKAKETKDEITKEVKTEVKTTEVKSEEVVAKPNDKVVKETKVAEAKVVETKVKETKVEKTEKPVKKGNTITVIAVFGRVDLKTTMVDAVTPVDVELTDEVKAALKWNIIKEVV